MTQPRVVGFQSGEIQPATSFRVALKAREKAGILPRFGFPNWDMLSGREKSNRALVQVVHKADQEQLGLGYRNCNSWQPQPVSALVAAVPKVKC